MLQPISLRRQACRIGLMVAMVLAGCASPLLPDLETRLDTLLPADALLLGEQHDAPQHQRIHHDVITALALRGQLAAVAIEMAEQGHSTATLPRHAREEQVRNALHWRESEWPWADYGPAVMAAVRHGVAVYGANLPRAHMAQAMGNTQLEPLLRGPALKAQQQLMRSSHCGMLPERQVGPMTRIQIARDLAMAHTVAQLQQPGKTVLLLSGSVHADRLLGVPLHLDPALRVKTLLLQAQPLSDAPAEAPYDQVWPTAPLPPRDYCALFSKPPPATTPGP